LPRNQTICSVQSASDYRNLKFRPFDELDSFGSGIQMLGFIAIEWSEPEIKWLQQDGNQKLSGNRMASSS
jgi:hypothetical protein